MTGLRPNSSWADFKASSDFNPVLATDVYSPNGTVASVKFYAGTGTTDLLGTATYADDNGNWTIDVSPSSLGGATTVTIVVADSEGVTNGSSGTTFSISPVSLGQITVDTGDGNGPTTTPVYTNGTSVTLSLANIIALDGGTISSVKFYRDTSGTGIYNPGTVQLLTGTAGTSGSAYTLSGVSTTGWIGSQTIFVIVTDSAGGSGALPAAEQVQSQGEVDLAPASVVNAAVTNDEGGHSWSDAAKVFWTSLGYIVTGSEFPAALEALPDTAKILIVNAFEKRAYDSVGTRGEKAAWEDYYAVKHHFQ